MTNSQPPRPPVIPGHDYVEEIGSGGYSAVYLYRQHNPDRNVAVKVLRDFGGDVTALRQFEDEARAMARLGNHAHIVQVFSTGVADRQPYLIMAFCPGPNLASLVSDGPLPVAEVVTIGVDIAGAVGAAHHAGIVHRDIKPANILTDEYDKRRLTDFGIAGRVRPVEPDADFGVSVPWSPPEILGTDPGSIASDVYSLGATLWHLLIGHPPFEVPGGNNGRAAMERRITTTTAPRISRPDAPAALVTLIARMLAPNPADRPQSALEVSNQLKTIQRRFEPSDTLYQTTRRVTPGPGQASTVPSLPEELTRTTLRVTPSDTGYVPAPVPATVPAPSGWPFGEPDGTIKRAAPPVPEPVEVPVPPRRRPWVWAVAGAVVLALGVTAALGFTGAGGGHSPATPPSATANGGDDQNAGVLGQDTPPGVPAITGTRRNDKIVHFVWTYSAALSNDTFRWRTPDGRHAGVAQAASVDLSDAAGVPVCIQVKVVRADGSNGDADWSPQGCAR